jgi:hypothetical protein
VYSNQFISIGVKKIRLGCEPHVLLCGGVPDIVPVTDVAALKLI